MHESYRTADWSVPYLPHSGPDATWKTTQSMLLVNWSWDLFIWDLKELLRLLTTAPTEFNYLFLTAFVRARAAYLAVTGPFACGQAAVLTGIGARRVQFAAIYYRLLLETLKDVLGSEDGERLIGNRNERWFQLAISAMERRYIEILMVIALAPEIDGELHGQNIESWVTGMVLLDGKFVCATPGPVEVRALTQCWGRHRLVRPSARDLVKKILGTGPEPMRSFMERAGTVTRTDIVMEKLSRYPKVAGYHVVKYGELEVQYYVTLTDLAKTTLNVVCADRTMKIQQGNGVPPGPRPITIEAMEAAATGEELYLVTFDSGDAGLFGIEFRPQQENEHGHVPPGVCNSTMFHVVDQAARGGDAEARRRCDSAETKAEVTSEQSLVKTVQCTKDRVEHNVEKTSGSGRVRVNLTVDTDGLVGGAGKDDISNVELKSHLDKRLDSVGREFSDLQNENDGLKHDLAQVMSNMARKVDPLFFQWIFVILGTGSVDAAAKELNVPGATFAERLQRFVARGGEYKKLYSMVGIRKKGTGRRRMVGFNEVLAQHQGDLSLAEPNVLRELLDGLEELDAANWRKMRVELIEIVRSELPEDPESNPEDPESDRKTFRISGKLSGRSEDLPSG